MGHFNSIPGFMILHRLKKWALGGFCQFPLMNFWFLDHIPWFGSDSSIKDLRGSLMPSNALVHPPIQGGLFGINIWDWFPLSIIPWAITLKEKIHMPSTVNQKLKRRSRPLGDLEDANDTNTSRFRFRPYVSKVPWHTGPRGFLSQLFPRYGHYCGPNWSSGKNGGSPIWDRRPIDWLDFCCYCHDIGYDSHNQEDLLKADLEFLECLEKPHMVSKGDVQIAHLYRTMCITGLRNILIPYRKYIVNVQSGQPLVVFGWLSSVKWKP